MFDQNHTNKQTWNSHDRITRNQIDHVLINARRGSSITNIRILRGQDADSGHFLVIAKCGEIISKQNNNRPEQINR